MNLLSEKDEITRFIFDLKHYSRPNKSDPSQIRIKKNAVAPWTNEHGEYETSVMKTTDLNDVEVTSLGSDHVAKLRESDLVAFVRFSARLPYNLQLKVDNDKFDHERHCSIKGWPASKEDMMEKADELAEAISSDTSMHFKEM